MKVVRIRNICSPNRSFEDYNDRLKLHRLLSTLQLVIMNCKSCNSVIYKKTMNIIGLRENKHEIRDVHQMKNINIVINDNYADVYCAYCQQLLGKISQIDEGIELKKENIETSFFHWNKQSETTSKSIREPFNLIGAVSGFRVKHIYHQLYRLIYIKLQKYQIIFKHIIKTVVPYLTRFKNFQCLINLIQNQESKYSIKMVDFDRMMLSTTLDNCEMNSYQGIIKSKQTPSITITNAQISKEPIPQEKNE